MTNLLVEALLKQDQIGVAFSDAHGQMRFNARAERMLGPTPMSGPASWPAYFHLYDEHGQAPLAPEQVPLARALAGELVVEQCVTLRAPGQPVRRLSCTAAPLASSPGSAIVLVTDLAEEATEEQLAVEMAGLRQRHHASLERFQQLASHLLSSINHQLRTPLGVLVGNLELLEQIDAGDVDRRGAMLASLQRAGAALEEIAAEITRAADIASAEAPIRRAIDLRDAVAQAVERSGRTGREVELAPTPHMHVTADIDWIRRGVVELISWMADRCAGAAILVDVLDHGPMLSIRVSEVTDDSSAPAPVRAPMPARPAGLGVVLADAVARAHGGELHIVESHSPRSATLVIAREPV
jgi:signal transduction histidine kinase